MLKTIEIKNLSLDEKSLQAKIFSAKTKTF
jgi:hypothetical protein